MKQVILLQEMFSKWNLYIAPRFFSVYFLSCLWTSYKYKKPFLLFGHGQLWSMRINHVRTVTSPCFSFCRLNLFSELFPSSKQYMTCGIFSCCFWFTELSHEDTGGVRYLINSYLDRGMLDYIIPHPLLADENFQRPPWPPFTQDVCNMDLILIFPSDNL